jgi:alkylation response protein AidB-like acyl-CoA dehydrogenase
MASGELVGAIAMTEPGAGSDLRAVATRAVRDGEEYIISGVKTFITNGSCADLIIVVAKTDPAAGHKGISLIGVVAATAAEAALEETVAYAKQRTVFGAPITTMQNTSTAAPTRS